MLLSRQIRSILTNPLQRWRKNSCSEPVSATPIKKKERWIVETLEPRVLLSADFATVAPIFSTGIDQLDDTLNDFFSNDLLNTPLPGIALYEQTDDEETSQEIYAPTLTDLLSVDVSNEVANAKLKSFDTNGDGKLTIQEFLSSGVIDGIRDILVDDPNNLNDLSATTGDEFKTLLETELENGIGDYLNVSNVTYTENNVVSLDFSFTNEQTVFLDLGVQAEKLDITLNSDIQLTQSLGFTLEFGVNDADGTLTQDDFFIGFKGLNAKVDANASLNEVDINFGFLGASIKDGSVELTASVKAADSEFSFGKLQNIQPGTLFNVEKVEGNFDLNLPVQVKTGLGFNPEGLVIDVTADPFAQSLDDRRIDLDLKLDTGFDDLLNFNNITANDFIDMLRQVGGFLENLGLTEAISSFEIPFTDTNVGEVLDFADTLLDALFYDDGTDDKSQTGTNKLLDSENNLTFGTAQDVLGKLGDTIKGVEYDPVKEELTYSLEFENRLFNVDAPITFDIDLSPVANITSDASLLLSGEAGMSLILGFSLGNVEGTSLLESNSPLTVNANAAGSTKITASENVKGLNSDGYKKILTETTLTIAGVEVSLPENPEGYSNVFELVRALNDSIAQTELKDKITISSQGKRLIISTTENFSGTLTVAPNTELGFVAESGEAVIEGNDYDFVITAQDGTEYGVSLEGKKTTTVSDLQQVINSATNGHVTLEINADNTGLKLTDTRFNAENTAGLFSITLTNGSAAALSLGILGIDANTELGEKADGIIEGKSIAGPSLPDRFFLENVKLWGDLDITTPNGIKATANFGGFVEIGLTGNGELSTHLETGLKSPGETEAGGRVTLAQLMDNLTGTNEDGKSKIFNVVALPTMTGGIERGDQTIYGELTLAVSITSDEAWINALLDGTGTPEIKLVAEHFGDPFGIDPNVEDGAGPKITVDTSSLNNFKLGQFADFGFDQIIDGLKAVSGFLSQFESFGFLDDPIPLINYSVNDLLGFVDDFNNAIQEARNDPAGSLEKLEDKLENALGLKAGSDVINLSLTDDNILKFELNLGTDYADSLDINLGLGEGMLNISGAANLDATGKLNLDLDFGIALDDPAKIYLFSTTGLAASLNINAKNVTFNTPIGSVKDGSVKLGASFNANLKDFDDRILITDLKPTEHFSLNFGGNLDNGHFIDSTLPVYLLTDSMHAGDLVIQAQDFSDIKITGWEEIISGFDISKLNLLDQALLLVDGIDLFLEGLQDVMDGEIGGISLPFIGDSLEEGARFIENFRNGFIEEFRAGLENAADPDENFISQELFKLVGPDGLNLLQDSNNDGKKDINDISLKTNVDQEGLSISQQYMEWDMDLGGTLVDIDAGIDFDLGIPGLGLETKGDIKLDIGWELDFGFGINGTDGVYFNVLDPNKPPEQQLPELRFDVLATLDGAELIGQLGFLQLTITEDGIEDDGKIDPTYLLASFAVDLSNKSNENDKNLSFSELGKLSIAPQIAAKAEINLDMILSLSSDMVDEPAIFPNLRADFVLDWSLGDFDVNFDTPAEPSLDFSFKPANPYIDLKEVGDAIQDGLKLVEFQNVSLSLGSYISDFVGPILEKIQDVTEPLEPIIEFLTTPFPVLSDLGVELTFLDLAEYFSDGRFDTGFLESVIEIIDFVNSIKVGSFDDLWINFGSFTIFDIADENLKDVNLTDTNLKQLGEDQAYLDKAIKANDNPVETAIANSEGNTRSGNSSDSAGFYEKLQENGSFDFPILSDPSQVFNLLLGKPATLITYDMKPLELGFNYSQFFRIWGPLGARIGASLGATIDFDFGFDTYGIQKFVDSDFVNPGLIFAGFFVDDGNHPELQVNGSLWAAAELNLVVAYGGVSGGLYATVNFDLFDPNRDGKVRVDEMINSIVFANYNPLAIFDISGDVRAKIEWYVGVDLMFVSWEERGTIAEFKLIDFETNFPRESILASDLDGGVLQLNMGDLADQRLNGNTKDSGEVFELIDTGNGVAISALGAKTQTYNGINKIVVRGGEGDDRIVLKGPSDLDFDIEGGVGNDFIDVSGTTGQVIVHGNAGDDTIITGGGDDQIWGDEGNDTITAGSGTDWIFGDNAKLKEGEDGTVEYIKVRSLDTDGEDILNGGLGDDIIIGGGGLDIIHGDGDNDLILGDRGTVIFGDNKLDSTNTDSSTRSAKDDRVRNSSDDRVKITIEETNRGIGSNDVLHGDSGEDTIYGGVGNDEIFGGDDTDTLYGEKGADTIEGGIGVDTIYGGNDNDEIFGGEGGDFLYGDAGRDGDVDNYSNAGRDYIQGDGGDDQIFGGRGADILHGNADNDTIFGGSDPDTIYGDAGNDILDGEAGSDIVFGYSGNYASLSESEKLAITGDIDVDYITSSLGDDVLDGEGGRDYYTVNMSGGTVSKHVTVFDTGAADSGADELTINGTEENDIFLLRSGVAKDAIAFTAMLNGSEEVERIDYDSQVEHMIINSFEGDDYFALDDNRAVTTINAGMGSDTVQVGQMFETPRTVDDANLQPHDNDKPHDGIEEDDIDAAGTDIFATIETTRGFLSNGISEPTTINGGGDNDAFIVFHNKAVLALNGGSGNDEFTIRSFALSGSQETIRERTDLSGGSDADLIQYAVNAPVNIDGGDGMDEIRIIGTEFSDDYVITSKGVFGGGLNVNFTNVEVLKVDGAEGDDRFFIQSTDADLVTKLVGGLGSDSFNVGGDAPPVISNDLLGHSGIISHTVASDDPNYDGIKVEGISANVADNDEPGIVVTQSDGNSVVNSNGAVEDSYTVVLTRAPAPGEKIVVTALAPTREGDDSAFIQFKVNDELKESVQLVFDSSNWNIHQTVTLAANSEVSQPMLGTIHHTITSEDSISGTVSNAVNDLPTIHLDQAVTSDIDLTGATIKITDGLGKGQIRGIDSVDSTMLNLRTAWNIVPDASSVYEITLVDGETVRTGQVIEATNNTTVTINGADFKMDNPGGDLRGATLQIISGVGAGQERLIMSNTAETLVVNKPWTTALDDSSEFQILRYDAVKAPSVDVYVNDTPTEPANLTQEPGVWVQQTGDSTDVIEGSNTDTYTIKLTSKPTTEVKVYVNPEPTITTRGQIFYKEAQVTVAGTALQSDENGQFVVFTSDNWNVEQTITVSAIDDAVVDGGDTKVFAPMPQIINPIQGSLYMEGMGESEISIGSLDEPLMLPGETNQKASLGNVLGADANNIKVEPQNVPDKYGDLVDFTLEITAGAGKGQARIISGYNPMTGVITFEIPWDDVLPDTSSEFTLSTTNPNLLVDETEQVDVVTVFNNDSLADDAGVLTQNRLSGFGMGTDDIVLEGTRFSSGLNYSEMENFTANLGKGDNQLTINGSHTREDGFRTVTLINANQGDDNIDVNLDDNQGFIAIKGETGNDTIDASNSELGIVAFGDEGDDKLTGGSGKDTLFGDRGRIDYLNEEGEVVTRLGLEHDFSTMFAVPQTDDETPADQTDGVMREPTIILSLQEDIGGKDTLTGLGGDDLLIGGSGADTLNGSDDNDIILGDNGYVDFVYQAESVNTSNLSDSDETSDSETLVSTMTPLQGDDDTISGGAGNDLIFAGTGSDDIQGNNDNDLIFGDHGRVWGEIDLSALPLENPPLFTFEAIDTQLEDGGDADTVYAGAGDDIILGQQGADIIYGEAGDDDIIGGHNVKGGDDTGDRLDGGSDDDVIAGDNAIIERRGDTLSLNVQTLMAPTLYDANGVAQITGDRHADPDNTQIRDITLLDHTKSTRSGVYGADYIAGGADDDVIFGQLGDDKIQGDGSINLSSDIAVSVTQNGTLTGTPSVEAPTDGDDYIEGNGGEDLIVGNLGQDDILGGNSDLFGLDSSNLRPDGADIIFGGAGTRIDRNDSGLAGTNGHARDADVILGDNGNIFRIVSAADGDSLRFNHDQTQQQVVRAYTFLDYTLGGAYRDIGTGDELHGEGGDDILHGMTGNDVLFGEGQDDDLYGGSGHDRLYGGTGVDGILGDDGLIHTSRNGTNEPLHGINQANQETNISIPGPYIGAIIHPDGQLHKNVTLLAYDQGATGNGNDVIYGGLDDDFLHGGEGNDAISGAEAIAAYYNSQPHIGTITAVVAGQTYTYQVDTPLPFDSSTGKFTAYDAYDPRTQIAGFLLDFDTVDAKGDKSLDGTDRIFGDLGHDWIVGGTENDRMFGGWGNDLLNADDNLTTNNGLNDQPDSPEFADGDFAFGGAGLDVLIANTGKDRLFDWSGEYNSYFVPFSPFGAPTVNRGVSPNLLNFVVDLGLAGGADASLSEPEGELALVTQKDAAWQDQRGKPRDPQPGNIGGTQIDERGEPEGTETAKGKGSGKGNRPDKSTDGKPNGKNTANDPYWEEPELPPEITNIDWKEPQTPDSDETQATDSNQTDSLGPYVGETPNDTTQDSEQIVKESPENDKTQGSSPGGTDISTETIPEIEPGVTDTSTEIDEIPDNSPDTNENQSIGPYVGEPEEKTVDGSEPTPVQVKPNKSPVDESEPTPIQPSVDEVDTNEVIPPDETTVDESDPTQIIPPDETPVVESPDTPDDNTPVNESPDTHDNTPVDESPDTSDNTPVDELPDTSDDTPVDNTPVDDTPDDNTPVNESPDTPVDNTPVDESPDTSDDTPVNDTPVDDTPDNTPVDELPDTPDENDTGKNTGNPHTDENPTGKPHDGTDNGNPHGTQDDSTDTGDNQKDNGNQGSGDQKDNQGNDNGNNNDTVTEPPKDTDKSNGKQGNSNDKVDDTVTEQPTETDKSNGNQGNGNDKVDDTVTEQPTETDKSNGNQGNDKGNDKNVRSAAASERFEVLGLSQGSQGNEVASDMMFFDETTGKFVTIDEQPDSDELFSNEFLIIEKGETLPTGAAGLIAW